MKITKPTNMKKLALVVTAVAMALFVLRSCGGRTGNGKIITEKRDMAEFTSLDINGVFPVELSQDGGEPWLKVQADENLQNLVVTSNNDGELKIWLEGNNIDFEKPGKIKLFVNVKDLRQLKFESVGNLTTKGALKLDSLEVNSESVGRLELNLTADFLRANLNSVGATNLKGTVREVRINNKSVGVLHGFNLKAETLMIHNTAIGSTEVYADSAFYIRSSAVGTLAYKGPGEVRELKTEGIGKVQKAD